MNGSGTGRSARSEVDAWCSLSYYPWGHAYWSSKWDHRPEDTPPVPKDMDWDLWIGPAPLRPYHPAYHPLVWRCWWDFGCGMMGDRGVHTLDSVNKALKLGHPSSIAAATLGGDEETRSPGGNGNLPFSCPRRNAASELQLV